MASRSRGRRVRRSSTSASMPCGERFRRRQRLVEHHPVGADGQLVAAPDDACSADLLDVLALGNRPAHLAIGQLVLEEEDRVGIADRGCQEALGIGGEGGRDDLEAGHMGVERLDRLGVVGAAPEAAAVGSPEHHRAGPVAGGAVADLGRLADQVVRRGVDEVGELDLGDRSQPAHGEADRQAGDRELGHRRVDDAIAAEPLLEAFGGPEDASQPADVLAEDDDPGVTLHLLEEGFANRLQQRQLAHLGLGAEDVRDRRAP